MYRVSFLVGCVRWNAPVWPFLSSASGVANGAWAAMFPRIIDGLDKQSYYPKSFVEPLLLILGPAATHSPFAEPPLLYYYQNIVAIAQNAAAARLFSSESYFATTAL